MHYFYLYINNLFCSFSQEEPIVFLYSFVCYLYCVICPLIFSMDSTPPSSNRMKSRGVKRGGRLESWFSGESEKIDKYLHETSRKLINTPKIISFNWIKDQKLLELRSLLKNQVLKRFLEMTGNIYPYLVRVSYTNLQVVDNNICSHVKGVNMEITQEV